MDGYYLFKYTVIRIRSDCRVLANESVMYILIRDSRVKEEEF